MNAATKIDKCESLWSQLLKQPNKEHTFIKKYKRIMRKKWIFSTRTIQIIENGETENTSNHSLICWH